MTSTKFQRGAGGPGQDQEGKGGQDDPEVVQVRKIRPNSPVKAGGRAALAGTMPREASPNDLGGGRCHPEVVPDEPGEAADGGDQARP